MRSARLLFLRFLGKLTSRKGSLLLFSKFASRLATSNKKVRPIRRNIPVEKQEYNKVVKYLKILVTTAFVTVAATFLSNPQTYMQSFLDGVTVWAHNVLPALFPFAVLSPLAIKFFPKFKRSFTKAAFGVRADDVYAISLLCGYPLGAKSIAETAFDKETATRLCSFCSSASPIFVVATVGTKLLRNYTATLILLVSHLLSTLINGLLYRKRSDQTSSLETRIAPSDLGDALTSSLLSALSVGGLIALFFVLTDVVKSWLPQAVAQHVAINFVFGLVEMTNGIIALCATCDTFCATVFSSFLLAFGGMCVFAQSIAFLADKIHVGKFLQMKFTQASIATLLSFVLCIIFLKI